MSDADAAAITIALQSYMKKIKEKREARIKRNREWKIKKKKRILDFFFSNDFLRGKKLLENKTKAGWFIIHSVAINIFQTYLFTFFLSNVFFMHCIHQLTFDMKLKFYAWQSAREKNLTIGRIFALVKIYFIRQFFISQVTIKVMDW